MTPKGKQIFLFAGVLVGLISACLGLETQKTNHLGWTLLFSGTALIIIECIYLGVLFMQTEREKLPSDRSIWLPAFCMLLISLVTPLEYLYMNPILARSDHTQDIGLILFAGGFTFYLISLKSPEPWKAKFRQSILRWRQPFSTILQILICPISSSMLLFAFGLGIGYSSLIGLLMIFLLLLPGLIHWAYRIVNRTYLAQ